MDLEFGQELDAIFGQEQVDVTFGQEQVDVTFGQDHVDVAGFLSWTDRQHAEGLEYD